MQHFVIKAGSALVDGNSRLVSTYHSNEHCAQNGVLPQPLLPFAHAAPIFADAPRNHEQESFILQIFQADLSQTKNQIVKASSVSPGPGKYQAPNDTWLQNLQLAYTDPKLPQTASITCLLPIDGGDGLLQTPWLQHLSHKVCHKLSTNLLQRVLHVP